jgi:hypothetical protein
MGKFDDFEELVSSGITDNDLTLIKSGGVTYRVRLETLKQFLGA